MVLADSGVVADPASADTLRSAASELGAELVLASVAMGDGTARHDPELLATAYEGIFSAHAVRRAGEGAGDTTKNTPGATAGVSKGR